MIPFNKPAVVGTEMDHLAAALASDKLSGDGAYGKRCQRWFETKLPCRHAMLTPSCTQALEMAAILLDIGPGDEVIMPSFTFVSTANAFALRGARIVFVDIRPDTMNLDADLVEAAVTSRTRAIVPMHYAGVACDMAVLNDIASRRGLAVVEDAAQGLMASYKGQNQGTMGHLGAISFHETKNVTSGGEGGVLLVNDDRYLHRAEIIREKGTNRGQFLRGMVDKYTWVDIGSSYLPSELQAAYLWAQLEAVEIVTADRTRTWNRYREGLQDLADSGRIGLPQIPADCVHNGHLFHLKCRDLAERTALLAWLKQHGVMAVFHYVPLHTAPAGALFGTFHGEDRHTTRESERLLRLPLWYGMPEADADQVVDAVRGFYQRH